MKLLILLAACAVVATGRQFDYSESEEEEDDNLSLPLQDDANNPFKFQERSFDQCLDHFDKNDPSDKCKNTWKQRYWFSNADYKAGGPLFINVGGEGDVTSSITGGEWLVYGFDYNPMRLILEHRFYGKSYPKPSSDRSSATMKLHTSRQALSDYAKLVKWFINDQKLQGTKVVTFGGSYPGTMAAWFRQSYPDIVNIAVSSSAPLEYQAEFPEYIEVSSKAIMESNPSCFLKIKSTFQCMEALVNGSTCAPGVTSIKNVSEIPKALGQCYPYDLSDVGSKSDFFINTGRVFWATNTPATDAIEPCKALLAQNSGDLITDYGNYLRAIGKGTDCSRRRRGYKNPQPYGVLPTADEDSDSDANYQTSYVWQVCNELGSIQISDKNTGMLGYNTINDIAIVNNCKYRFPDTKWTIDMIKKNVAKTVKQYNGRNYNGTCTIFTHGSWDPWHVMGIYKQSQTSKRNTVIFIEKGEHTNDMDGRAIDVPNKFATAAIAEAQEKVKAQLKKYLNDPKC